MEPAEVSEIAIKKSHDQNQNQLIAPVGQQDEAVESENMTNDQPDRNDLEK